MFETKRFENAWYDKIVAHFNVVFEVRDYSYSLLTFYKQILSSPLLLDFFKKNMNIRPEITIWKLRIFKLLNKDSPFINLKTNFCYNWSISKVLFEDLKQMTSSLNVKQTHKSSFLIGINLSNQPIRKLNSSNKKVWLVIELF